MKKAFITFLGLYSLTKLRCNVWLAVKPYSIFVFCFPSPFHIFFSVFVISFFFPSSFLNSGMKEKIKNKLIRRMRNKNKMCFSFWPRVYYFFFTCFVIIPVCFVHFQSLRYRHTHKKITLFKIKSLAFCVYLSRGERERETILCVFFSQDQKFPSHMKYSQWKRRGQNNRARESVKGQKEWCALVGGRKHAARACRS